MVAPVVDTDNLVLSLSAAGTHPVAIELEEERLLLARWIAAALVAVFLSVATLFGGFLARTLCVRRPELSRL
jgi:hypothetical protein